MKVAKGLALFLFFSFLFGSCFNPPEFPNVPQIGLVGLEYWKKPKPNLPNRDSLVVQINFHDGDGDLGLPTNDVTFQLKPYNAANYFQTNSAGELVPVDTDFKAVPFYNKLSKKYDVSSVEEFIVTSPSDELVLYRTKLDNPLYSNLPDLGCTDYISRKQFIIKATDSTILSPYTKIDTTITLDDGISYIVATDTVYFTRNPDQYNIDINYFVQSGNTFELFDLWQRSCGTSNGRFPVLTEKDGNPIEGTLTYGIVNNLGFERIFPGVIKIQVMIRDRALNKSNVVESEAITLKGIKKS